MTEEESDAPRCFREQEPEIKATERRITEQLPFIPSRRDKQSESLNKHVHRGYLNTVTKERTPTLRKHAGEGERGRGVLGG